MVLATIATVIASQALISGAFSLTHQAIQLGYSPRVRVRHTSESQIGQIYVPAINWVLMLACIGLVLGFRHSANLAAAYGVAVTTTMVMTTMLFSVVARRHFGWPKPIVVAVRAVPRRRYGVLRRDPVQDPRRRLVPAHRRSPRSSRS